MTIQLDLFAAAATPLQTRPTVLPHRQPALVHNPGVRAHNLDVPLHDLASLLPRRPSIAWERRIAAAGDLPLELHVAALWTGVVVEVLSLGAERQWLLQDGSIRGGMPPDGRPYRAVFVTPAEARAIAGKLPLRVLSHGTASCRVAGARHAAEAWGALAEWLDGIEAAGATNDK